jgi:hypothetical protein
MKLFLLENESSISGLRTVPGLDPSIDVVIAFNHLVCIQLTRTRSELKYIFCEELLDRDDFRMLHDATDRIADGWYKRDAEDYTLWEGVSCGDLVKGTLSRIYLLGILVKYGEIVRKALVRWPCCGEIVHDFSGGGISTHTWADEDGRFFNKGRLVELVARHWGINCRFVPPPQPLRSAFVAYRHSKSAPVGTTTFSRWIATTAVAIAQATLNVWSALLCRLLNVRQRVYLYHYSNNLGSILERVDRRFVLRTLPAKSMPWRRLLAGASFVDFDRIPAHLSDTDVAVLAGMERELAKQADNSHWREMFRIQGIDYFPIYQPVIAQLARTVLRELVHHMKRVRKGLREHRITKLILNDTLDEKNQAVVAACALEGVCSIFVDHGIMGLSHATRASDRAEPSLVISPGSFDPYRHRVPVVPLGNPCIDQYAQHRQRKIASVETILFLTFEDNFYARFDRFAYQERYYEEIFSIFDDILSLGVEILYKPHPGESQAYHEYLFEFFSVPAKRIRYVQRQPFADVIKKADLVVCNISSCLFEALAAGVPTVFLEPVVVEDALCPPLNGEPGKEVLRVTSGREVLEMVRSNRKDPTPLNRFVENFLDVQAPRYMGPLDGSAQRRIMDRVLAP